MCEVLPSPLRREGRAVKGKDIRDTKHARERMASFDLWVLGVPCVLSPLPRGEFWLRRFHAHTQPATGKLFLIQLRTFLVRRQQHRTPAMVRFPHLVRRLRSTEARQFHDRPNNKHQIDNSAVVQDYL